jgi:lysozyme
LGKTERAIKRLVNVPVNQLEYDALTSFTYNEGPNNLASSTLLKKLNQGDYDGAANEFPRWIYAGGKPSEGLRTRRLAEQALFNNNIMFISSQLHIQY